ncbi:MAG TPA: FtsH protease activity modulator HflK [Gammaproteobacteria bacterium]|nr:FtsH protease activity modulator HflK [Gammaproteobacteria bacterium]
MAWNEPGGPKDKDPWGGQGGEQGPPDLDEVVRRLQDKLGGIFGGRRAGGRGGDGGGKRPVAGIGALLVLGLVIWGLTGFYIIDEGNRGVVLRFGKYQTTTQAGLHWHIPYPVETVQVVNVEAIRNVEIGYRSGGGGQSVKKVPREALMLTQDENIIDIQLAVQYKIKNAKDYLFNLRDPDLTLHEATESAIREVIGKSSMDFVLTEGRSEIVARTEALTQEILDRYRSGLLITSVNMQDAQPPEEVQDAFNDAIKAREDEQRLKNEAEAYANDVLPKARGKAARMLEEASAYKAKVVAQAEGEASRFTQLLSEYKKAPEVTRERLYLDTLEAVLDKSSKVMLDVEGGNNLLFLPLDRLMHTGASPVTVRPPLLPQGIPERRGGTSSSTQQRNRRSLRSREVRR